MGHGPIMVISGTHRPGSNAMKIARILEGHYRQGQIGSEVFSLAEMPREIFDAVSYAQKPRAFAAIQERIIEAAGLHVITPEYNGSFPGVLKHFIDMLKFPESLEHKPVAFVGEAAGAWGAMRSVEQLQLIFAYRNAHIFPERVFIPAVNTKLDEAGNLNDPGINQRLAEQARGFAEFIKRIGAGAE